MTPTRSDGWERVATWSTLEDRRPVAARVQSVSLVIIRYDDQVSVLHGRCPHRGAPLADASVEGRLLVCAAHGWDFDIATGHSPTDSDDCLTRFDAKLEGDAVLVNANQVREWLEKHPQTFEPDEYLGA